MVKTVMPHFLN